MWALLFLAYQGAGREPLAVSGIRSGETIRPSVLEAHTAARRLRVLDATTARPLAGVEGELWVDGEIRARARSGLDGGLVLPEVADAGSEGEVASFVFLAAEGYRRSLHLERHPAGHFLFPCGPRLEYRVLSFDGGPIAGAELRAFQAAGAPSTVQAVSDSEGRVVLEEFPPLYYGLTFEVRAPGCVSRSGLFYDELASVPTVLLAREGDAEELRRAQGDDVGWSKSCERRILDFHAHAQDGEILLMSAEFHAFRRLSASSDAFLAWVSTPSGHYLECSFVEYGFVPVHRAGFAREFPQRSELRVPRTVEVDIEGPVAWVRGPGFAYGTPAEDPPEQLYCNFAWRDVWEDFAPGPCSLHVELQDGRAYDLELTLVSGEERTLSFY